MDWPPNRYSVLIRKEIKVGASLCKSGPKAAWAASRAGDPAEGPSIAMSIMHLRENEKKEARSEERASIRRGCFPERLKRPAPPVPMFAHGIQGPDATRAYAL
jgi:hypothetical protein